MSEPKPTLLRQILRLPAEILVGMYVIVDAIIAPLFRPIMRWLSRLRIVQRLERWIASLPPYVILVVLVGPFAIAELAKVFAVFLMSEGHFRTGMTIFIGAYIVSILVCERIFHAGKDQLMTIPWFAKSFRWIMAIKDHILDWFRQTRAWQAMEAIRQKTRIALRRVQTRMRALVGIKPKGLFERR